MKLLFLVKRGIAAFSTLILCTGLVFAADAKIDVNSADAIEMAQALTGIGEKKAQAIVEYRTNVGEFTSVEELTEVKGITNRIIELNKDKLEAVQKK